MRHQPMLIAFIIAMLGAAAVAIRPGAGADDWGPLLMGAALSAAATGIAASVLQFLPPRLFGVWAIVAGMGVAFVVAALLSAAAMIGLAPIPAPTALVWAGAAIVGLFVSRASGVRLPPARSAR